jgi:hypothetical protein
MLVRPGLDYVGARHLGSIQRIHVGNQNIWILALNRQRKQHKNSKKQEHFFFAAEGEKIKNYKSKLSADKKRKKRIKARNSMRTKNIP